MEDNLLIEEFNTYLYNKNFSYYTISNYIKDIEDFKSFIRSEKMAPSLDKVTRVRICQNYISYLNNQKYSAKSINRKMSSLRTFYNYLLTKKYIDFNYFNEVANVKTPKKLPSFVDQEDVIKIIEQIDTNSDLGFRNKVLIELMYATGIRVGELCSLEVSQIDFYQGVIKVFGKGKKERLIYLYDSLKDSLNYYVNFTRSNLLAISNNEEIRNVFINYKGTPLTPRGVRKILNSTIEKEALNLHVSPHMLRHSFATSMLNNGMDLRSVQTLLGHENLSTTQIYTHVSKENILKTFNDAFPRSKKTDEK